MSERLERSGKDGEYIIRQILLLQYKELWVTIAWTLRCDYDLEMIFCTIDMRNFDIHNIGMYLLNIV